MCVKGVGCGGQGVGGWGVGVGVEWRQRRSGSLCLASSLIDWSVRRPKAVVNICLRVLVRQEGQARHVPPSVSLQETEVRACFFFFFFFNCCVLNGCLQLVQGDDQAAANSHRWTGGAPAL